MVQSQVAVRRRRPRSSALTRRWHCLTKLPQATLDGTGCSSKRRHGQQRYVSFELFQAAGGRAHCWPCLRCPGLTTSHTFEITHFCRLFASSHVAHTIRPRTDSGIDQSCRLLGSDHLVLMRTFALPASKRTCEIGVTATGAARTNCQASTGAYITVSSCDPHRGKLHST